MGAEHNYVGRKVGYMRVSTDEQDLQLQRDALIRDGVPPDRIFFDKMSGKSQNRPGLRRAIKVCWEGDIIVVWKLDRLGRSLSGLIQTMEELEKAGIGFRSITEQFDTSAPGGRMLMQMMMVMAEFERSLIAERTKAGIAARKAADPNFKMGPKHRIRDYPKRLKRFIELDKSHELAEMTGAMIVDEINKIPPKDLPMSVQSLNNWKSKGFNGYEAPEGGAIALGLYGPARSR